MEDHIQYYQAIRRKLKAYHYIDFLLSWDQETEAPFSSQEYRSKQYQVIAEEMYKLESDPKYMDAIEYLYNHLEELEDPDFRVEIKQANKGLRLVKKVPKDEFIAFQVLAQSGSHVWIQAKNKNDFELFQPTLEKIVDFQRKLVKYLETDELKGYDVLLDMFEEGMGMKEYDAFFDTLKLELVPFVSKVVAKKKRFSRKLTHGIFPIDGQRQFSHYLLDVFKYDRSRGLLKESAHPFTSGVSSTDTRITTHFYEDNLVSSIFSTIHEMGHAIYELQNDPKYDDTFLHGGSSLGIHESQSRMYENMIGRQKAFWDLHYPKLVEIFPKQLKGITVDEFVSFVNTSKRSLIRVEADELTYGLHIMVRYELEKLLITGKLKVKDLPKKWNQLMGKFVGIRPKTDTEGVLQDIHWSTGMMGYFPTYALGSAYAAQIYQKMDAEIDVTDAIQKNEIERINLWLKDHIHTYGSTKTPKELMLLASKEPFNPMYYVNYLKEKYRQE